MDNLTQLWNEVPAAIQGPLRDGSIALVALIAGRWLYGMLLRKLSEGGLDETLWVTERESEPARLTPSKLASGLATASVWAGGAWSILQLNGAHQTALAVQRMAGNVWVLALLLFLALAGATWVARALAQLVTHPAVAARIDSVFGSSRRGNKPLSQTLAGGVRLVAYGAVMLLAIVVVCDVFEMRATATFLGQAWTLCLHACGAALALLVGWIGVTWVRSECENVTDDEPDARRTSRRVGLGIISTVSVLGAALLLSSGGTVLAIALIGLIAFVGYPFRTHVQDVLASIYLKAGEVKTVMMEGRELRVDAVRWLDTRLQAEPGEEAVTLPNRVVMEASRRTVTVAR